MSKAAPKLFLKAIAVLFILLGQKVIAQSPSLRIDPHDTPLVISGVMNGQTTSFSGNVRLTISEGNSQEVLLLPSDLRCNSDPNVNIDRSNVTIPGGISLSKDQPRDIRVSISNITRACEYTGTLKFIISGQPESSALVVELKVKITAQPDVKPVTANPAFQVVRCQTRVGCAIADLLLPSVMSGDKRTVQLDNQTPADVVVAGAELVLRGDKAGHVVTSNDIEVTAPQTISAGKVTPISLRVKRSSLLPDHYQGSLRLRIKGLDQPVTFNVALDVRNGLAIPLLILLAGVLVGRLVQSTSTPAAQAQVRLLRRYYSLQSVIGDVGDKGTSSYLAQQMESVKRRIELATEPEETLNSELTKIETYARFLLNLESIERQLTELGLDALAAELIPKIREARLALMRDDVSQAELLRKDIESRLRQAEEDTSMGASADLLKAAAKRFHLFGDKLDKLADQPDASPTGGIMRWIRKFVIVLAGSPHISAETRYWLVRPLLFIILLLILVLLGLQTLYINAGATFGAGGLYDYLGLFIWGLSADVAQRTLQNLQLSSST